MPRIARIEIPGLPYHIIQRGNRNQKVFIRDGDKNKYLRILKTQADLYDVEIWAYCLMDNHVHLVVMPKQKGSLTECIGETHKSYSRMVNFRENWYGHLWQGRFLSYPMDERYLWAAVRYVERNPVRASIVKAADDYPWSSARAHIRKYDDGLLTKFHLANEIKDWKEYLSIPDQDEDLSLLRSHQSTGRPLGEKPFVERLEAIEGRPLAKRKTGPKHQLI